MYTMYTVPYMYTVYTYMYVINYPFSITNISGDRILHRITDESRCVLKLYEILHTVHVHSEVVLHVNYNYMYAASLPIASIFTCMLLCTNSIHVHVYLPQLVQIGMQ